MTRDELIAMLALDVGDRPRVDEFTWPLVVEFVADWLDDVFRRHWIDAPREQLLQYWREEMTP